MLDIFSQLLESILPSPECVKNIKNETPETILRFYMAQKFSDCVYLSNYKIIEIKSAIIANKFHNNNLAAKLLSSLLKHWLKGETENVLLVPIPLSQKRRRERGYNQVQSILKELKNEKVAIVELLKKVKDTIPQTKLNRVERLKNQSDVFVYELRLDVNLTKYRKIILVDDVITTGTTLKSAKKALIPHLPKNCEVVCLAITH